MLHGTSSTGTARLASSWNSWRYIDCVLPFDALMLVTPNVVARVPARANGDVAWNQCAHPKHPVCDWLEQIALRLDCVLQIGRSDGKDRET